jgi:2-polyprenyl-3-methyl-5-hydroxy-6-metoxy-1,4-benzoquinol methylase
LIGHDMIAHEQASEVAAGQRFEFGKNWARFLAVLDDQKIATAQSTLQEMLEVQDLKGKSFLDIGSGSGLFSLAARRLGARVHSFDYDPHSVGCTLELKRRYFPNDSSWMVESGSALDRGYLAKLGTFDVVYSWGVLHHPGSMWEALENAATLVAPGGKIFIAIYNDRGPVSSRWRTVKHTYNRMPRALRFLVLMPSLIMLNWRATLKDLLRLRPFQTWRQQANSRGMSPWHDLVDWVGGYPFEYAKPEAIFDFYRQRGMVLTKLVTDWTAYGCNQFVFLTRTR